MAAFKPQYYFRPSSVEEAVSLLLERKEKARILGGGTEIYELAQRGLLEDVDALIDLQAAGLDYVKTTKQALIVGATTTFTTLLDRLDLRRHALPLGALLNALKETRPVQVRNVATIGGCICSGLPFFDLPVALAVLGAEIQIVGPQGERKTPLESFLVDYFVVDLREAELVTAVQIPVDGRRASSAFVKFALTGDDWALVNAAAKLVLTDGGVCKGVRVAVGGAVGSKVVRATSVEKELEGKPATARLIKNAAKMVVHDVNPASDVRASADYRRRLSGVLVERVLNFVVEQVRRVHAN